MIDRSKAPSPFKNIPFQIPEVRQLKLSNGIETNFVRKEKLPIVFAEVIVFSGSKFDPLDKRGLCYLTSLSIDEGAAEYDALQLSEEFEKLGTVFSVGANHDTITLSVLSLKENFERSLELLSKIIIEPRFAEKEFAREKKKVLDRILQLKDEPSFIASSAFEKRVFGNTYYSFPEIGYESTVSAITNNDVKNFYISTFTASNAKIVVVGNLREDETTELFNKNLSSWNTDSENKALFETPKRCDTKFYFVHKKNSAQSEIRIGHISKKRNAEDFIAARIMNTILGGQFSSRLNLNLRENKGFTYGAGSSFQYYKDAGLFEVATAVDIENSGAAISEILKELRVIRENISSKEIEFAKSYLTKQFPSRFETYSQVAKNIESLILHSVPFDELFNYTQLIESAANDEVQAAAMNNIFPDEMIIVATGDREKIFDQLKNVSGKEPVELDMNGNLFT